MENICNRNPPIFEQKRMLQDASASTRKTRLSKRVSSSSRRASGSRNTVDSTACPVLYRLRPEMPPIYSSVDVPRPMRVAVMDPPTHMPSSMIRITRDENGIPKAKFPPSWRNLGWVVYMWMDTHGKMLIGSSGDFRGRFYSYLSAFRGKGAGCTRSLPRAVQKGMDVYVGIAMVCSTKASMKQNETSLIVQKKRAGYALYNVLKGEGDPKILLGSPTADGRGGQISKKLLALPGPIDRLQPPISDTHGWTPKRYFPVFLKEDGTISVILPERWKALVSVIYVFRVQGEDGLERRLIGETGRPLKDRVYEYTRAFNNKGDNCDMPLPVAVRDALESGRNVAFSVLGVCSPNSKTRKKFEAHFIDLKYSLRKKGRGFNQRMEDSPSRPGRVLYQPPSPDESHGRPGDQGWGWDLLTPQRPRIATSRPRGKMVSRQLFLDDTNP